MRSAPFFLFGCGLILEPAFPADSCLSMGLDCQTYEDRQKMTTPALFDESGSSGLPKCRLHTRPEPNEASEPPYDCARQLRPRQRTEFRTENAKTKSRGNRKPATGTRSANRQKTRCWNTATGFEKPCASWSPGSTATSCCRRAARDQR